MAVEDWSTTAGSNTSVGGVSIAEGWSPASVNNALRGLMAEVATWRDGAIADLGDAADYQPLDATLTDFAALTTAADKGIYADGSDSFATYDLTSFGRTLGGLASYAALRTALGAVTVTASSLGTPGYITFDIAGTALTLQWGAGSISANSTGTITFPTTFSTWAKCIVSGGRSDGNTSTEGDVHIYAATGLSSQVIAYSGTGTGAYNWFAIGR